VPAVITQCSVGQTHVPVMSAGSRRTARWFCITEQTACKSV